MRVLLVGEPLRTTGGEVLVQLARDSQRERILLADGEAKGKTFPGIYKLEKGELTLVFTEKGDRPKEFKSDDEVMLLKLKKVEKK